TEEFCQETGRYEKMGQELLRIKDRHDRDFVVQPTSEEVVTDIARQELRSYKQLPKNFYQIQTKFRDERRPRFGLMRGREFIMKDRSEEHTSELQSRENLVCRLLLEKKKNKTSQRKEIPRDRRNGNEP